MYFYGCLMAGQLLIQGGTILRDGSAELADILVSEGRIKRIGSGIQPEGGCTVIDARGLLVTAGFTDIHVHLREPGNPEKETIRTGTMAAARGGYTTVCAMPNLSPVPDSPEHLAAEAQIIARDAVVRVLPYASITLGRKGLEPVDMEALKPLCVAFSDDGSGVQDDAVMLGAMRRAATLDAIITAHCEDNSLLRGGYIHDGKYCAEHGHRGICSESEWGQIRRDLQLCESAGCRYHVCHISTAESVELIRNAKRRGVRVTCETAPHYLLLCDEQLQEDGRFKMNPPIRSASDRDALLEGLLDGTIDAIATDHAPHTAEQKSRGLEGSAMGVTGLEAAFPVLYTGLVLSGKLSLGKLVDLLTDSPRRVMRIEGGLCEGASADITLIDLEEEFTIRGEDFLSKGHSTPFEGMRVRGRVKRTLYAGETVWEDR